MMTYIFIDFSYRSSANVWDDDWLASENSNIDLLLIASSVAGMKPTCDQTNCKKWFTTSESDHDTVILKNIHPDQENEH